MLKAIMILGLQVLKRGQKRIGMGAKFLALEILKSKESNVQNNNTKLVHLALLTLGVKVI